MDVEILRAHPFLFLPDNLDEAIWRYMSLWKFVSLLQGKALHFSKVSLLDDVFEGALSELTIAMRPALAASEAAMVNASLPVSITPEDVEGIFTSNRERLPQQTMVNCWHLDNGESAAMWGLYCPNREGVAIRSTVGKLIDVLPDTFGDFGVLVSEVSYSDYGPIHIPEGNWISRFVHKRTSFSYERELRALMLCRPPLPPTMAVPVSLNTLVEAVYVAPKAPQWHLQVIEALVSQYGLNVLVRKSSLDDPALY